MVLTKVLRALLVAGAAMAGTMAPTCGGSGLPGFARPWAGRGLPDRRGDPDAFTGVGRSQPGETLLCLSGDSVHHVDLEGFIRRGAAGRADKLPSPPSYGPVLWHGSLG